MKTTIRGALALAALIWIGAAGARAADGVEPVTVLTYNLGLLKAFGSDYVPMVDARTAAAPRVLTAALSDLKPDIVLLEEVWTLPAAEAIASAVEQLGYAAAIPSPRTVLGLGSGLLLLVKPPFKVVEWGFQPFKANSLIESIATRKGVLTATLEIAGSGTRFAFLGTHTIAIDTKDQLPVDRKQVSVLEAQEAQILAALRSASAVGTVPALLVGDFNVGPGYADALYRGVADSGSLREAGDVLYPGAPLATWDPGNPLVKFGRFPNEPASKIDHVFMQDSPVLGWRVNAARVVLSDPIEGLSLAPGKDALKKSAQTGPVPVPLSDHYAFMAELELAGAQ
jgi:hypothetical protein